MAVGPACVDGTGRGVGFAGSTGGGVQSRSGDAVVSGAAAGS
jgi:hypothetical protein